MTTNVLDYIDDAADQLEAQQTRITELKGMMDKKIKAFSAIDRALGMLEGVVYGVEDGYAAAIEDAVGRIADALEVLRCDTT